jgi:hypothetical protein
MRTQEQGQQDRGDLQQMMTEQRPNEDALAAASIYELCRTIDDVASAVRVITWQIDDAVRGAASGISDVGSAVREVANGVSNVGSASVREGKSVVSATLETASPMLQAPSARLKTASAMLDNPRWRAPRHQSRQRAYQPTANNGPVSETIILVFNLHKYFINQKALKAPGRDPAAAKARLSGKA